jgi:hypothetical protein
MAEIPDSISFSELRKLKTEKSDHLDFSDPRLSDGLGDLAFLVTAFISQKCEKTFSHQQIFLLDVLVTNLRVGFQKQADKHMEDGSDLKMIAAASIATTKLLVIEKILDELVEDLMKSMKSRTTLPSYRLAKSLDPAVKPHEIEEWIKSVGVFDH